MAQYETKAVSIGDITLTASKASKDDAASRLEAVLKWLADQIDNSLPGGKPDRPDQGLPGSQPGVDNTLPGGKPGKPDQSLPGSQPEAGNELPGGPPKRPDQGLPGDQPGAGNELPGGRPDRPSQGLPGSQPSPGQDLPLDQLSAFIKKQAKEIAAAILKDTACDPAKPKK